MNTTNPLNQIPDTSKFITVVNAQTHNLRGVTVSFPKNQITVVTGVSGSGKSSLAFDTVFADSQRRYIESLSSYARQFLQVMDKPDVEEIHGLIPAIAIDQKTASHNPRSTVGTVTEIYDHLRLLYARVGTPHCTTCGRPLKAQTKYQIANEILHHNAADSKIMIMGRMIYRQKGEFKNVLQRLKTQGYTRIRLNNDLFTLDEPVPIDKNVQNTLDVIVDRLVIPTEESDTFKKRLTDALEQAITIGEGDIIVVNDTAQDEQFYSTTNTCPTCHLSFPPLEPNLFSFNSHQGACPHCQGLGYLERVDSKKLYNPNLSINEGGLFAVMPNINTPWFQNVLLQYSRQAKFRLSTPLKSIPAEVIETIFYGFKPDNPLGKVYNFSGIANDILKKFHSTDSSFIKRHLGRYIYTEGCDQCFGSGLNQFALAVKVNDHTILDMINAPIGQLAKMIKKLSFTGNDEVIAAKITKQISDRLHFLQQVGLDYVTLSRRTHTLSGGEAQRVRLASQLGTGLTGILYVLDEPSIGLHMRDVAKLIDTLKKLCAQGNTILMVEHDIAVIKSADYIIEIGPKAGEHGGKVVFAGTQEEFLNCTDCVTSPYLNPPLLPVPPATIKEDHPMITIEGAKLNNLKNITTHIPLNRFTVVSGISGSGKSSLIFDTLYPALKNQLQGTAVTVGPHRRIENLDAIEQVIHVDQTPIGTTPRSIPATYINIFNDIRKLFAMTQEAKARGYKIGHFSFNTVAGQCPKCHGTGYISVEMLFLPDLEVRCDVCNGQRYKPEILDIDFNGKNIFHILDMTVEEARHFFKDYTSISRRLQLLKEVGLDYIRLGQSSTTLSGGESQRIKLTKELSKMVRDRTLYLLDEPTIGLHADDIKKLLTALRQLISKQATVVIIEHNPDLIREADWIIDLGPEGGSKGGMLLYEGPLAGLLQSTSSPTGEYLRPEFKL